MSYTPKTYSDDQKNSVRVASTGNVSLSAPGSSIDGVTLNSGDRVLLKNQSTGHENGIYNWHGASSAMTRSIDANANSEVTSGMEVFVEEGTTNASTLFVLTTANPITLGTTSLTFSTISGGGASTATNNVWTGTNEFQNSVTITSGAKVSQAAAPTSGDDLTNKTYVDSVSGGGGVTLNTSQTLTGAKTFEGSSASDVKLAAQVASDAANRLKIQSDGKLLWGDGTNAPDVTLERSAASIIKLGSGDKIQQNSAPTTGDDLVNKTYVDGSFVGTIDSRLTDSRTPSGSAGGDLSGTYPNPTIGTGKVTSTHIADGTIVNDDISASAAIALSKLATDPLARSNHTGTQSLSTISDAGTAAAKNIPASGDASNTEVVYGTDTRLTNSRTPSGSAGGDLTGTYPNPTIGTGKVTSSHIADGTIVNDDINASAGISLSKLATDPLARANHTGTQSLSTISDAGTSAAKNIPASGNASATEVVYGTDTRLTDSRTPSGSAGGDLTGTYPNPTIGSGKVTSTHIADGTIVNDDINASAAIALSKLATDPLARANHTGTQTLSTISDAGTAAAAALDTDSAFTANSDTKVPSQKAVKSALDTKISSSEKGSANGVASLDGGGKVPVSQLPNSIMEYKGTWNATSNSPSLSDGTGNAGDVYRVSTAGSQDLGSGSISFDIGDYAIYNAAGTWEKADTTDAVSSVAGRTGAVTLTSSDVGLGNVTNVAQIAASALDTDSTFAANSDAKVPSQKAVKTALDAKQASLGFTAENVANKDTDSTFAANSDTKYPSQKAVKTALDAKQNSLGYTAENSANKDTDSTFAANSDTRYPSQKAVKTALDAKQNSLGYTAENSANKDTDSTFAANSDTRYPSQKAVKTALDLKANDSAVTHLANAETITGQKTFNAAPRLSFGTAENSLTLSATDYPIIQVSTATGAKTITLPASPTDGLGFWIIDKDGSAATNNITIGRGGKKIDGATSDLVLDTAYQAVYLAYDSTSPGWHVMNTLPATASPSDIGSASVGTSKKYARADHTHALGTGVVTSTHILDGTIVNADINASAAIALSKLATDPLARANHTGTQTLSTISDAGTAAAKNIPASGNASATEVVYGTDTRLTDSRAPSGSAGGDLTGTYPNPTIGTGKVTSTHILDGTIVNEDISASAAIALSKLATDPLARANHTGTQTLSTISDAGTAAAKNVPASGNASATEVVYGTDTRLTNSRTPSGNAGGDLTGSYPDPTIGTGKVTSTHILDGTIVNGDISASAAIALSKLATDPLARANHTGTQTLSTISDAGTAAAKNIPASGNASATEVVYGTDTRLTNSRAPSGAAGGDLTGTYPDPTIGTGKVTSTHILDGTIVNADINASAAIDVTKLNGSGQTAYSVPMSDGSTTTWSVDSSRGYKLLAEYFTNVTSGLTTTQSQYYFANSTIANGGNSAAAAVCNINSGDFSVTGKTTKMFMRVDLISNATAMGASVTLTFGLRSVVYAGGAGVITATGGASWATNTVVISNPSASAVTTATSTEETLIANGAYLPTVVISGANQAANNTVAWRMRIYYRHA